MLTRRGLLAGLGAAALPIEASDGNSPVGSPVFDLIVVGGGTAGLSAAIAAGERGRRVLVLEAAQAVGGTLFLSGGMMAAAGTRRQGRAGIVDSPQRHFDDVMAISRGTADPVVLKAAVTHAAAAVDWLEELGVKVPARFPISGPPYHDAYSVPRYVAPVGGGRGILAAMQQPLSRLVAGGRVILRTGAAVTGLVESGPTRVSGVAIEVPGAGTQRFFGDAVLLATGGYTANAGMVNRLEGKPDYALGTYPQSQGAGLDLAASVGGHIRGGDKRCPGVGAILASRQYPSPVLAWARWWPPDRPPWEIQVNALGQRFFREDAPSFDVQEQALAKQPGERAWIIFDERIRRESPPLVTGVDGKPWAREQLGAALGRGGPMFNSAGRIEDLAGRAGLPAGPLARTIAAFNQSVRSGRDPMGRRHMPRPLEEPPFHAIETHGTVYVSAAGVAVDHQLRVMRENGQAIRGLYAAGEILGAGQLMGRSICGGMMVTPALALGRHLGSTLV